MSSPLPTTHSNKELPDIFSQYFNDKICAIRQHFPPPDTRSQLNETYTKTPLLSFTPVSEDLVLSILKETVPKSCELDPIPSKLLYEHLDALLPAMTTIINDSLSSGNVPSELKHAIIKPLLKKPSLDKNVLKNYRPISNLPFLSKILEKVVLQQLLSHLQENGLCNAFQSAYRAGHSTETALLRVVNDLLHAIDNDKVSVLLLLDLSAAFDTVDHQILLSRLQNIFGIRSTAFEWFQSYLKNRTQSVSIGTFSSAPSDLKFGVPQGSVLGPVLFVLYTTPLSQIIQNHSISHQLFADDTQLHDSCSPTSTPTLTSNLQACTADIKTWMSENQLKLNDDKTEAMLFKPINPPLNYSSPSEITVGEHDIPFSDQARNLGFILDSQLSMKQHVIKVCQIARTELRRISTVRKYLSDEAAKTLVTSCVLSRLDYCNSLLMGADKNVIAPMQRVQNSAARVIFRSPWRQSTTPLLRSLHWLPISERINYKVGCICFHTFNGSAPSYITEVLPRYHNLPSLRSAKDSRLLKAGHYNRKRQGYRALSVYGPTFWNALPHDIRHCQTISSFKSNLKTFLFNKYFN